jgi:hypothetical protein
MGKDNLKTESNNANVLFAEVAPRQKFVLEMEQLLVKLKAIDKETPWQHVEPEWWLAMSDIERMAIAAVQKFKK